MSAILGRPMCITDEDIDAHLPLEVDDEGWDEANQTWTQPDGKPSLLAYLTNYARLMGILTRAMRTIYSISKSKARFGMVGPDWEQNTVAELDSALNEWLDAVPDHLRWDPHMDSKSVFYRQAAALRLNFYYVQITIHRPFVQLSSSSKRALSLPSLAICTNAARSSARILSATMDMTAPTMFPMISFISGLILLISIWEARRSGLHVDISQQIVDVQTCLMYLKKWEHRYYLCGRLYDILRETAFVSDVAVPTSQQHIPPSSTDASDGNGTAWDGRDPATGQSDQPQSASDHVQRSFNPHSITVSANGSLLGPTSISSSSTPSSPGPSQSNQYPLAVFDANDTSLATNAFINQPGTLGSISILNNNDSLAALNSTWENYHLAGLDMGFQGFPGYNVQAVNGTIDSMAPDTFWYELLGPLVGGGEDTELYH
ncbi:hypothetical protein FRB95_009833 [Tulasnella sp. JGI-2019a]|nr:hypothetical protein FRB95_009833 [Tulasnella sp. JGI-2019a]